MILIVDDKQENLFSLQRLLQIHDFKVDIATSGEEALKKILKHYYALIILDVQMPGMDGFEVAEVISGHGNRKIFPSSFYLPSRSTKLSSPGDTIQGVLIM